VLSLSSELSVRCVIRFVCVHRVIRIVCVHCAIRIFSQCHQNCPCPLCHQNCLCPLCNQNFLCPLCHQSFLSAQCHQNCSVRLVSSKLPLSVQCHHNCSIRLVSSELSVSVQCHQNYLYLPSVIEVVRIRPLSSELSVSTHCQQNCPYPPSVIRIVHILPVSPRFSCPPIAICLCRQSFIQFFSRNWLHNLCCCNLVHCKTEALDCLSVLLLNATGSGVGEMIVLTARCWMLSITSSSLTFCTECDDIATNVTLYYTA